ncbi:MAG: hypothetical protein L0Y56_13380, partial [Nitrospira sp.]|nr:hypothetical protein [Nitrospira sp.]
ANNAGIKLRVYSYVTNPAGFTTRCDGSGAAIAGGSHRAILDKDCDPATASTANRNDEVPIVIRISGTDFNTYNLNAVFVRRIVGNTPYREDIDGDNVRDVANEDTNNNDILDTTENDGGNGLDVPEDLDGSGVLECRGTEDRNCNGVENPGEGDGDGVVETQDAGYLSGKAPTQERVAGEMWYEIQKRANPVDNTKQDLIILLHNTPLRQQLYAGANPGQNTGLPVPGIGAGNDRRLYGMEYIPAPTGGDFTNNLTSASTTNFKNTARWIITLTNNSKAAGGFGAGAILNNNQLEIETRIGPRWATAPTLPEIATADTPTQYITRALAQGYNPADAKSYLPDPATGRLYGAAGNYNFVTAINVPSNVSRTYVWITDITCNAAGANPCIAPSGLGTPINPTRAGQAGIGGLDYPYNGYRAPFTERFQYLGDPRHNPYLDVKLDLRYNWFFRDNNDGNGFAGFGQDYNGWTGRVPFDYPRMA